MSTTTTGERWLAALLPFVRDQLPPDPTNVLETGRRGRPELGT